MIRTRKLVSIDLEKINCNAKKAMEILEMQTWFEFEYKIDLWEGKLVVNVKGLDEECVVKLRLIMLKDFNADMIAKSILHQLLIRNENTVKISKKEKLNESEILVHIETLLDKFFTLNGEVKIDGKELAKKIIEVQGDSGRYGR